MANTLYDKARELFLTGQINWVTDTIKVMLVDQQITAFNPAHDNLDDISPSARVAGPVALGNSLTRTAVNGAADGPDITFSAVSGAQLEAIVIFKEGASEATSPLIAWIDTAAGLPITPNGGDIIVTWDNGVNKIFRL